MADYDLFQRMSPNSKLGSFSRPQVRALALVATWPGLFQNKLLVSLGKKAQTSTKISSE